ncbi:MAG: hypothetical protein DRR19_00730 [Candidatus Parabeggiatoa sp. nov. 1]|nr:MAG: hypothetical protein DRR19_00730 [Gammaproteobacteria bacterium]
MKWLVFLVEEQSMKGFYSIPLQPTACRICLNSFQANLVRGRFSGIQGEPCTRPILRNTRRTLYEADSQEYKANLVREGRVVIEVKYIVLGNWELGTRLKYKNRPSRLDNPGGLSKYHRFFTHP